VYYLFSGAENGICIVTKFVYDSFAKNYLRELLLPFGSVEIGRDVVGEVREIDVYFEPSSLSSLQTADIQLLGLLGQLVTTPVLFEPFRYPTKVSEVRSCSSKLFDTLARWERDAKRNGSTIVEAELPRLWILTPTASEAFLNGFGAKLDLDNWSPGVYFFHESWRGGVIAIHQLPVKEETLSLRILGKGKVQQKAVEELQTLAKNNPLRAKTVDLLLNLKTTLEIRKDLKREDRDFIMKLSPIYEQRLAEVREEGIQTATQVERQNFLRAKFGTLDEELVAIMEPLLALPSEEFALLLLNSSRDDLLARFSQS
jgi:hypothetical protein